MRVPNVQPESFGIPFTGGFCPAEACKRHLFTAGFGWRPQADKVTSRKPPTHAAANRRVSASAARQARQSKSRNITENTFIFLPGSINPILENSEIHENHSKILTSHSGRGCGPAGCPGLFCAAQKPGRHLRQRVRGRCRSCQHRASQRETAPDTEKRGGEFHIQTV